MSMITVEDGVRLHVQDLGHGPAVVLVSGFGLDNNLWDRQVAMLTGAGFRTVCITQRGHGRSDHPLSGYDIDRLSADVVAVLRVLDTGPVTLVGHSFGGMVGLRTAALTSELVQRLVLVGSNGVKASRSAEFPFGPPQDSALAKMAADEHADRIAARYPQIENSFGTPPDPRTVAWLMRTFLEMPSWSAIACYRTLLSTDLIADLPKITQPVLQIAGTADPVQSPAAARWVNERLTDSTLVELTAGHFAMLEAPDPFDTALTDFLAEQR